MLVVTLPVRTTDARELNVSLEGDVAGVLGPGGFRRKVNLPTAADGGRLQAGLFAGILELRAPRADRPPLRFDTSKWRCTPSSDRRLLTGEPGHGKTDDRERDHPEGEEREQVAAPPIRERAEDALVPPERPQRDQQRSSSTAFSTWVRKSTGMSGRPGTRMNAAPRPRTPQKADIEEGASANESSSRASRPNPSAIE